MNDSLYELIALAKEPSSEKRRELLHQITDVFMSHTSPIPQSEMVLFDSLMTQISKDMELVVRTEISEKLSTSQTIPEAFLKQLIRDQIEVAGPILSHSSALSDHDLLEVVTTQGQDHMRAVAKRKTVSESISGVIVERGDDQTLHNLLCNYGARLSRESNEQVVLRAQSNPDLHEVVINRQDLPLDLMNDMYFVVEARLRARILSENAKIDPAILDEALTKGHNRLAIALGSYPADYEAVLSKIKPLHQNNELTPSLLARYMRDPSSTYFLVALSLMADIDFLTAKSLSERREIDAIAVACKAADLDKPLFLTYIMIVLSNEENAMGKAAEYGNLYTLLPRETALRTIRFWRMRRSQTLAA